MRRSPISPMASYSRVWPCETAPRWKPRDLDRRAQISCGVARRRGDGRFLARISGAWLAGVHSSKGPLSLAADGGCGTKAPQIISNADDRAEVAISNRELHLSSCFLMERSSARRSALTSGYLSFMLSKDAMTISETISRAFCLSSAGTTNHGANDELVKARHAS
jgi:hypothetical protein